MARDRLTCLSTFTGLGGLDLGLEAAGFENVACVEWDEGARRSLKANRGDRWNLLVEGDIEEVARTLRPSDVGLKPSELDVLSGAPPCQPYSKAAQWAPGTRAGLFDRRGQYLDDFLRLLRSFLPKVAVIENVRGFVAGRTTALPHVAAWLDDVRAEHGIQYRVEHRVINAADHGVPQHRVRAFVVVTRLEASLPWPSPMPARSAWDAIGELEHAEEPTRATGRWADLLPSIPEGENYLWHTRRGGGQPLFGYRTRYWSFLLKLRRDLPSWTLSASAGPATGPFHWDNRPLSVQEMLLLQSFPGDWIVEGADRERVRQVGNATPPLLAEAVGLCVGAHLRGDAAASAPAHHVIAERRPVPSAAEVAPVPESYLEFVGDHADHPGHGRGPGALRAQAKASAGLEQRPR